MKIGDYLEIIWSDARLYQSGWISKDEIFAKDKKELHCLTVGILTHETSFSIIISSSVDNEKFSEYSTASQTSEIPKHAIIKKRRLT